MDLLRSLGFSVFASSLVVLRFVAFRKGRVLLDCYLGVGLLLCCHMMLPAVSRLGGFRLRGSGVSQSRVLGAVILMEIQMKLRRCCRAQLVP